MAMAAVEHDDTRWREWERGYRTSSRRAAVHARIAFAVLLTGAAAWLGLQLFSMPA
jgi:hypothetical protein